MHFISLPESSESYRIVMIQRFDYISKLDAEKIENIPPPI